VRSKLKLHGGSDGNFTDVAKLEADGRPIRASLQKDPQNSGLDLRLVMQNDIQQGTVDFDAAVVVDEA